jgi:hypothetical protein
MQGIACKAAAAFRSATSGSGHLEKRLEDNLRPHFPWAIRQFLYYWLVNIEKNGEERPDP